MKLVKLTQDTGREIKDVWLNPIYLVALEPAGSTLSNPEAHGNETMVRTAIGIGFAMQSMREIEVLLEEWEPSAGQLPARRLHRRKGQE